jgi:hypothetical protein
MQGDGIASLAEVTGEVLVTGARYAGTGWAGSCREHAG